LLSFKKCYSEKISEAISSTHFQIAEKALSLWNNEYILSLVADNIEVILPIIFPALYHDAKSHWNKAIRSMAYTSIRLFMDINEVVFGHVIDDYKKKRLKETQAREQRVTTWKSLFVMVDPDALKIAEEAHYVYAPLTEPAGDKFDPLLSNNDGLPLSVRIPHHLNQLVDDEFDVNDPVFKELTQLHEIQINKKLRKKELLPVDRITAEAMMAHRPIDDQNNDSDSPDSYDTEGDGEGSGSEGDYETEDSQNDSQGGDDYDENDDSGDL